MRILVTGAAGFVGSNFVGYLLNKGSCIHQVRAADIRYDNNLLEFELNPQFEFMYGDITIAEDCEAICKNIDLVCHLAAAVSVPKSILDPITTHDINVTGFIN